MSYTRARQCLIALLIAGNVALAWQLGDALTDLDSSTAEVRRLEGVNDINVRTIARLKSDTQHRLNEAFRHYGENKVRKFLKRKGQADI